jgi:predicted nucleic acid-binding protein
MSTFLDTNVVAYAFDTADPDKQARALAILASGDRLVVSTQVLLETWWVLTRRLAEPVDEERASEVVDTLAQLPVVHTDPELVLRAIATSRRHRLAVWDALILEAARSGGCRRVLSEDLQDGFTLDTVTVSNPFR